MPTVLNLSTLDRYEYSCTPVEAVVSAYAHSRRDGSTWEYTKRYGAMVRHGRWSVSCGDFSALKEEVAKELQEAAEKKRRTCSARSAQPQLQITIEVPGRIIERKEAIQCTLPF
jgi:hypothetical protein